MRDTAKLFFMAPAVLYILALSIFPLALALIQSLTNAKFGATEVEWVGLRNYVGPFSDYRYFNSIRITLFFAAVAPLLELSLGLILALMVNREIKGKGVIRALLLVPLFVSPIAVALMGHIMFYEAGGPLNGLLKVMGLPTVGWRSNPNIAVWTVIMTDVWMWTPFAFIVILAALQGVPRDVIEAAVVDGASGFTIFRRITLAIIAPAMLTVWFFRLVDTLRLFEIPFTMLGGGGPGITTETLTIYIYKIGFRGFFFGQAAAVSFLYLAMVAVITTLLIRRLRRYYV